MADFDFEFHPDRVDPSAFVAGGAVVLGDVTVGAGSGIWFHAVVRGDTESVCIGRETNIQDCCVLHADPGFPCILGNQVTVGHAAIVHGARIDDEVMIGMCAVILNGAHVGTGSIVGAGAVVTEGMAIPPHSLVFGVPGKVVRETTEENRTRFRRAAQHYVAAANALRQTEGQND